MGWWCLGSTAQDEDVDYPSYWNRSKEPADSKFVDLHVGDLARESVQELIDDTFRKTITRDRRSQMPQSLQVITVVRMENAELWRKYAAGREKIRKARRRVKGKLASQGSMAPPKTARSLHCLDEEVQESYLFHGTDVKAALQIQRNGFKTDMARQGLFGCGVYFAEATSKADEYAGDDSCDFHVMLLSRVVRGVAHRVELPDSDLHRKFDRRKYDSLLGDREAAVGTYREYVVYDEAQTYPEYAVIYRRIFHDSPKAPPLLLNIKVEGFLNGMMVLRNLDGYSHRVVPVPARFSEYLRNAQGCPATAIDSHALGIERAMPDVLLVDSTGDGEYDVRMMAIIDKDIGWGTRRTWVSIPKRLEFPLAALRGDLHTVKALAEGKQNLAEPVLHGMTALSLARTQGHSEVAEFLQEAYKALRTCEVAGGLEETSTQSHPQFLQSQEQNRPRTKPRDEKSRLCQPLQVLPAVATLEPVKQQVKTAEEASRLEVQAAAEESRIKLAARLDAATVTLLSSAAKSCPEPLHLDEGCGSMSLDSGSDDVISLDSGSDSWSLDSGMLPLSRGDCAMEAQSAQCIQEGASDLLLSSAKRENSSESRNLSSPDSEYWTWDPDLLPLGKCEMNSHNSDDSVSTEAGEAKSESSSCAGGTWSTVASPKFSPLDFISACEQIAADIEGGHIKSHPTSPGTFLTRPAAKTGYQKYDLISAFEQAHASEAPFSSSDAFSKASSCSSRNSFSPRNTCLPGQVF